MSAMLTSCCTWQECNTCHTPSFREFWGSNLRCYCMPQLEVDLPVVALPDGVHSTSFRGTLYWRATACTSHSLLPATLVEDQNAGSCLDTESRLVRMAARKQRPRCIRTLNPAMRPPQARASLCTWTSPSAS